MNNYSNYKHYDDNTDTFCKCGARIEDPQIFAEGTEYEQEVWMCKDCFWIEPGNNGFAIL